MPLVMLYLLTYCDDRVMLLVGWQEGCSNHQTFSLWDSGKVGMLDKKMKGKVVGVCDVCGYL